MGGTSATMMDGAGAMEGGGMAADLGSAGEFDASKSIVAGPNEYGSGNGMSNASRVPDFYDDAGQPLYLGEAAGGGAGSKKDMLKKFLDAISNSGSSLTGGGGGAGGGGGGQTASGQGPMGANQFYVSQPWNIPNINDSHPEKVNQATYKAIMTAIKMAAGGMG